METSAWLTPGFERAKKRNPSSEWIRPGKASRSAPRGGLPVGEALRVMTMGMVYWEHHHAMLSLGLRVLVTLNQCLMKTPGSRVLGTRDGTANAFESLVIGLYTMSTALRDT